MLFDEINVIYKTALKNKETFKKDVLSVLISNIQYEMKNSVKEANDEFVIDIVATSAKKCREIMALYKDKKQFELLEKEKQELEILEQFLPKQLSEEEIKEIIQTKITEVGAIGPKDMGRVMSEVMKHVKGRADGKIVNSFVRDILVG